MGVQIGAQVVREGYHAEVRRFRVALIQRALEACHGNVTHAAQRLGLGRPYLGRLIKDLGIDAAAVRRLAERGA